MLIFSKKQEFVERSDGGFFLLRHISPMAEWNDYSDYEIIEAIILSKFHHWRGEEEPEGLTVHMTSGDQRNNSVKEGIIYNHKFYGFFDNRKILSSHYEKISFEECQAKLMELSHVWIQDKDFDDRVNYLLEEQIRASSTLYHLNLDKTANSDLVAEFQVYDFFLAFIAIDKNDETAMLMELGLD